MKKDININTVQRRVQLFQNDKALIITSPKIAHSWCKKHILPNEYDSVGDSFGVHLKTFKLQYESNEYTESINKTWKSFLSKKEKKDLIILYRNPLEHLLSGFMQDWGTSPTYDYKIPIVAIAFADFFFAGLSGNKFEKSDFFEKYNFNGGITNDLFTEYPFFTKELLKLLFDYYLKNGRYADGHFTLWLTFINNLIESDKFDSNKIQLINIYDSPLERQLENYIEFDKIKNTPRLDNENIRKHKYIFDFLKEIIKSNKDYNAIVATLLQNELGIYDKLESIKDNKSVK